MRRSGKGQEGKGKKGTSISKSAGDSGCCKQVPEIKDAGGSKAWNSTISRPAQRPQGHAGAAAACGPKRVTCVIATTAYERAPLSRGRSESSASRLSCSYGAGVWPLLPSSDAPAPGPGSSPARPGRPPRGCVAQVPGARGLPRSSQCTRRLAATEAPLGTLQQTLFLLSVAAWALTSGTRNP